MREVLCVCFRRGASNSLVSNPNAQDSLAERSKAVAQGAIPKGRGFEPHRCHFENSYLWASASRNRMLQRWKRRSIAAAVAKAFVRIGVAADVFFHRTWYEKHDLIGGMAQRQRV